MVDDWGLRPGDTIAVVSDNTLEMIEIYRGALRTGLFIAAVNHHLTPEESTYIVDDCGARALFVSAAVADHVDRSPGALPGVARSMVSGSGPTVALLASGQEGAIDLAVSLTASGVADEVLRAVGPVAGAHVIPTPRLT